MTSLLGYIPLIISEPLPCTSGPQLELNHAVANIDHTPWYPLNFSAMISTDLQMLDQFSRVLFTHNIKNKQIL